MAHPTMSQLRFFLKDEKGAVKMYRKAGLHNLEKDERKHRKFIEGEIAKRS